MLSFLEAIKGREILFLFGAATLAGIGFYFARTGLLLKAENALNITPGGVV